MRAVRGPVHLPGEHGYNAARLIFNRRFDGSARPRSCACATPPTCAPVRWADRFDVPLTVRSGGHAYNGASTSRHAVVVDMRALDGVRLSGATATVGPGARNIDVYAKLARQGVTIPSGSCPTVGVGGLATGGGMGLAGRELGLTIDRVRGYNVVTADGRLRHVDADRDEDLYWALRGGGGSFGIVTARAAARSPRQPRGVLPRHVPGRLARGGARRLGRPRARRAGRPDRDPHADRDRRVAFGQYFGSERACGGSSPARPCAPARRRSAPGRRITSRSSAAGPAAPTAAWPRAATTTGPRSPRPRCTSPTSCPAAGRRAFVDATATGATLILDAYGGAITPPRPGGDRVRAPPRALQRAGPLYTSLATARDRVRRARPRIAPYGNGQAYQNYSDLDLAGARRAYYGANYERLVDIKTAVDPANRFRPAQGIQPKKTSAVSQS